MSTKRVCLSMFAVVPFHSKKNDTQAMLRVFYVPANLLPQIAFRVHGTVQGVGYRDFTQKCATSHGLKGWCRNTTCGRVEGEIQGEEETVKKLLQQLDKGPRMAHVVKLEKRELEPKEGEDHFSVMRTMESRYASEG
ncbi:unnamed protein product [Penicillium pancosmium]